MDSNKAVLTPYDIAEICHIGLNLVYRQLKAGVIPSVKVGDKYLIGRVAFEKWLEGNQSNMGSRYK